MLAVTLGHTDSAVVLLQHEANVNTENTQGWTGNLFGLCVLSVCVIFLDVYTFNHLIYFYYNQLIHYYYNQFNLF